jgi:serine/threonine protein kinase
MSGAEGSAGSARAGNGGESSLGSGPTAFGKYQLFASLGRGGMADVFLALSRGPLGFNKLVVVKRLRSTLSDEASYLEMFLDEARLAARLNHPNVVHTYEVGEHEGAYFIAMEYLEGQPLNKIIRELAKRGEELEPPQCARIVSDALLGLHHAHELKDYDGTPLRIVHRDVSPHNVFVTYDGQVKLVDFGIAKAGLSSTETEVGVLKGKVAYMSPEQAMGIELDRRADLFSMGIVLWELLTRKRLMQGDSAASTLHHILNSPIARVSSVLPRIDPELDAVVAKALDKNPDHRFQDALAMREALERWIRVTGQNVRQEEIGERVSTMFDAVRADVKRQIQQHMAAVATATSPQELAQLSLDSLRRFHSGMAPASSAALLPLGSASATGSGSGVVALGKEEPLLPADPPPIANDRKKRRAVLLAFVLLVLAALGAIAFLLVKLANVPRGEIALERDAPTETARATATIPSATSPASGALTGVEPSPSASATVPASAAPVVSAIPKPTPTPVRSAPTQPAQTRSAPASLSPATPDEGGYFTFDTYPWSRVSENGRLLGTTPLIRVAMPAGPHTVVCENPDQSLRRVYSFTIKSGATFSIRLALGNPK